MQLTTEQINAIKLIKELKTSYENQYKIKCNSPVNSPAWRSAWAKADAIEDRAVLVCAAHFGKNFECFYQIDYFLNNLNK